MLGKVPSCDWVQDRLPAYCTWDLPLREFAAIETHLHQCPACAAEHAELKPVIQELTRAGMAAQGLMSPEQHAEALIARIRTAEAPENGQSRRPVLTRGRLAALATAAVVLIIAAPVLAYVGHEIWQALVSPAAQEATASSDSPVRSVGSGQSVQFGEHAAKSSIICESGAAVAPVDAALMADLDRITEEAITKGLVEAMLPHTEQEYEAWARQEYPHIMWLYDVLTGEAPARTMDSPAGRLVTFGTDDNGNPAITLPDTEGNMVTLCAVRGETGTVPSLRNSHVSLASPEAAASRVRPRETLPSPSSLITLTIPSEPWDGKPSNIPDWAQRLYANTPESERPTGWRALLIYSGEIFKFDYPETLDEPNCAPTAEAVKAAAAVLGLNGDSAGPRAEEHGSSEAPIADYANALAAEMPRAQVVAAYIHTSTAMIGTSRFDELGESASAVLAALCGVPEVQCATRSLVKALANLLGDRDEQIGPSWPAIRDGTLPSSRPVPHQERVRWGIR